jgi:type I restriction enzyme S subunit
MPEKTHTMDWTRVTFGDVAKQVRDRVDPDESGLSRYVAGEHMDTDDLHIRRWGTIGEGYLGPAFHMRFKHGHVLYGSRRTYLRKVAVADFEGITANTTFVIEPKDPATLLPEFLPFVMQTESFHEHSIGQSKGSVNPYINFSDLVWYEFALPPLEEQRRIAQLLAAGDAVVQRLQEAAVAASTLYSVVGAGDLVQAGSKGVDPTDWKPPGWTCVPLEELVLSSAPICYGIVQVGRHDPDGVPTLAIKDLKGDYSNGVHRTAPSIEGQYVRSRIQPGDLLLSIKATIGEVAVVPEGFVGNISRDLARLRFDPTRIDARFFRHLYRSPRYTDYVTSRLVGSTRAELSIATLRDMLVPVPPVVEQVRIVEEMDTVQRAETALSNRALQASLLSRRIVHRALSQEGGNDAIQ